LRRLSNNRFLAVVGPPGSGKSSLVRAGLLPALYRGFLVGATSRWRIAVMRPGNAPMTNLAKALTEQETFAKDLDSVREVIGRSSLGLLHATQRANFAEGESLLVVVDQFEELFRFQRERRRDDGGSEGSLFVASLLEAIEGYPSAVYVVVTMRTDYLGDCAEFEGLPQALNRGQYLIPKLRREERREAIERPLDLFGVEMTPRLVQRLLCDLGDDQDQLPLLQHALNRTYSFWKQQDGVGAMDFPHYEAAGGIDDALNNHADFLYETLPSAARIWVEPVFRCLTMWENGRAIRRPGRFDRLLEIVGAKDESARDLVRRVILHFANPADSLLCSSTGTNLQRDSVIDISHETLIWNWSRLRGWLREEAEAVGWYQSVVEDAMRYRTGTAGTWRDPKLARAQAYIRRGVWNQAWAEEYAPPDRNVSFPEAVDFLKCGAADQNRERRRQRGLRNALTALALGLVVAGAATAWSWRRELAALDRLLASEKTIERLEGERRKVEDEEKASRQKIEDLTSKLEEAGTAGSSQLSAELAGLKDQIQAIEKRRNEYDAKVRLETAAQQTIDPLANVRQSEYAEMLARLTRLNNYNKALVAERDSLQREVQNGVIYTHPQIVQQRAYTTQRVPISGLATPLALFMDDAPRANRPAQLFVVTGGPALPNFSGNPKATLHLAAALLKQGTCSGPIQNNSRTGVCYAIPNSSLNVGPRIFGPFLVGQRKFQLQVVTPDVGAPLVSDSVLLVIYEVHP
jgi:energy-coupling factor transporter ATP-binding protein EcfA2